MLSKIWQKDGCLSQEAEIEEACELKDVSILTRARKGKRHGRVAIMVDSENYSIEKIENYQNATLDTLWAIIRPKSTEIGIFPIIACALYCPPQTHQNTKDNKNCTLRGIQVSEPNLVGLLT